MWIEPWQEETKNVAVHPGKTQISPGISLVILEFSRLHEKAWVLSNLLSAQQILSLDWPDAQSDLSLCWMYTQFVGSVMLWLNLSLLIEEQTKFEQ